MVFDANEYRRSWPAGFVTYVIPYGLRLATNDLEFLSVYGLPKGREPEWVFTGILQEVTPNDFCFGTHCLSPLLLSMNGKVFKVAPDGSQVYMNGSIQKFAECLTLRKHISRGKFSITHESDIETLSQKFLQIDDSSLAPGSYWSNYIEEAREELDELGD